MKNQPIAKYIDHTLLKATATTTDIQKLCEEAIEYQFFSVCVNSAFVAQARAELKTTAVKVCSVVGFPLGAMSMQAKIFEAKTAIADGAEEVDMVINIGQLQAGNFEYVLEEISAIKRAIGEHVLKVIIETCYLTSTQITKASQLAVQAKADFVKTSTGFGTGGATLEAIQLMKNAVEDKAALKASGGIRDYETAKQYIAEGVTRIGTSNGIAIVTGAKATDAY